MKGLTAGIGIKHVTRWLLYFLGLFIIAIGINLAIKSNLGVSPVSAFTVPVSLISKISLGTVTVVVYALFVLIQIAILGKRFKLKHLLQVPFSVAFGFFIDYAGILISRISLTNYTQQLAALLLSIVICSIGATIYITMDIVPNAPEGLILAICERFEIPFSRVKLILDCIFVAIGVALSLLFLGGVTTIREGTVISALLTGKMIGLCMKIGERPLKRIAFTEISDGDIQK